VNRPLPPGDRGLRDTDARRKSGPGGIVRGPGRLVGGAAAVASELRVGHCCATFGPRSFLRRGLGVSAKTCSDFWRVGRNRGQKQKGPPRRCRAGQEGGVRCYWLIR
jgi:hypothetical protein